MISDQLATTTKPPTDISEPANSSSGGLSANQIENIRLSYRKLQSRNLALLNEITFILRERLEGQQIKIHALEARVKDENSLVAKCVRRNMTNYDDVTDCVGARIVCLFRSDMERVESIIRTNFEVATTDNKLMADNSPLGYVSIHYLCKMPTRYIGPRYESTAGLTFEIQVRTLCMHCWAAVSHHLDYKGDWDVPAELKRALSALSGLFYVADREFEQFNEARLRSLQRAETIEDVSDAQEINLDTVTAYIKAKFPDRRFDQESVSSLVHQIKEVGYLSIQEVDKDITRAERALGVYEPAGNVFSVDHRFSAVGAARVSLRIANPKFDSIVYKDLKSDPWRDYRHLVAL